MTEQTPNSSCFIDSNRSIEALIRADIVVSDCPAGLGEAVMKAIGK